MKSFATKLTAFVVAAILLFASCSRNPDPVEEFSDLQVFVDPQFMSITQVDSIIAIWEVNGARNSYKMEREIAGNRFVAPLARLRGSGLGKITLQLYSQVKVNNQPLQWEHEFAYTLDLRKPVTIAGPQSLEDPAWKPRVFFHFDDPGGAGFSLLVALRPSDPYFELKGVEYFYTKRIEIVRSFHEKESGTMVFSRGWVCDASCLDSKGNLVNKEHFQNLAEQLEGRNWGQYRVNATFHAFSEPGRAIGFGLLQNY